MTLRWECADIQIVGDRSNQEDYCRFHAEEDALLCVLADGMGGHAAGEVAAKLAVDTFLETCLQEKRPWSDSFIPALNEANRAIARSVNADPSREGMGCTLVAADLSGDILRWISVGDSSLLHYSGGELHKLNADHSMAAQLDALVRKGEITEEQARQDPSRHMLLSALTGEPVGRTDFNPKGRQLAAGDLILLASDGLDTLGTEQTTARLDAYAQWSADDIGRALVSAVVKCGKPGQDNTTVMVLRART